MYVAAYPMGKNSVGYGADTKGAEAAEAAGYCTEVFFKSTKSCS